MSELPVEVGVIYEGERIRGNETYVELGGPKVRYKAELVRAKNIDEVEDGKIIITGKDIKDMAEGEKLPFCVFLEVAGELIEKDLESVIERRFHEFCNYVEGFMHLNQRYDIWCRLSKSAFRKGFNTFEILGKALMNLFKAELPIIERIQITFITDENESKKFSDSAREIYEKRDERARGLRDEDVDEFYSCTLCQSFAPTHVCVISPNRISSCGSITWFDARAAAKVDPKGPNEMIEKGELLDATHGEYSGVNKFVNEKSLGEIERIYLYSMMENIHTSCGCFEGISFYIPEVDGVGIVDRSFSGDTVIGIPFSSLATEVGGGRQVIGFVGIAIEYLRSPKFLQADGGWNRVVWMPDAVKVRVKDAIPPELFDSIATEHTAPTLDELKAYLKEHQHPVVKTWKEKAAEEEISLSDAELVPGAAGGLGAGGFRILLKNAKIYAEKVIIRKNK